MCNRSYNNMLRRFLTGITLCITPALLISAPLTAFSAETITPGAVEQTLRPTPSPPKEAPPVPALSPPMSSGPPAVVDERRVKIENFVITGNTVFTEAVLKDLLKDLAGTELTLKDMYGAADRLTEYYQKHGYSLCTVTVPAQRMKDGILQLEVIEGRVGKLLFTGNQRYSEAFLQRHFEPLEPKIILRLDDLERELLLLNDMPGLMVRSALVPGEEYGSTDIQLDVKETPFAANATLDNQGRDVVGLWRLGADFTINNPAKFGDVLGIGYTHSQSNLLRQGRLNYGFPLTHDGARLNLNYSRAEYDVAGDFTELGISGVSETARLQLNQPIIRTRGRNLAWTFGLAHVIGQSETDLSSVPLSDDEINFLETGLDFSRRNKSGGQSTLSALLATNFQNNPGGTDSAALPLNLKISGSHEQVLGKGWSGYLRGEALFCDDTLPDSNKYGLGGTANIRGFVSSTLRGDQGGSGSLELRRQVQVKSANILLRGFIDAGEVRQHDTLGDSSQTTDTLASAGAGASIFITSKYSLDLTWAKPIDGNESGDGNSSMLWTTLTGSY